MLGSHFFGPSAIGDPDISGLFIDDDWNANGLIEEGPGWMEEMELMVLLLINLRLDTLLLLLLPRCCLS